MSSTTYASTIHLPGGVVLHASIEVPTEAGYRDQGELGEVAQHAVNHLAGAVSHLPHVRVDRPRPADPWADAAAKVPVDPFYEQVEGDAAPV